MTSYSLQLTDINKINKLHHFRLEIKGITDSRKSLALGQNPKTRQI